MNLSLRKTYNLTVETFLEGGLVKTHEPPVSGHDEGDVWMNVQETDLWWANM